MVNLKDNPLLHNQSWINSQWRSHGTVIQVVNPASQQVIAQVPAQGADQATEAIQAAYNAFSQWRTTSCHFRSAILHKIAALLTENTEVLAALLTAEQGKPLLEARGEIAYAASYFTWYAEEALRLYGRLVPAADPSQRILISLQPLGVVTAITPWNFPIAMLARKLAPALAAGCTFVAKPAMETPLSALALAHLTDQAGAPPGVVNIVLGADAQAIGEALTQHPLVAKFSFTGSTATGKKLLAQCASGVKRTSLELGGNAPFIVFDDADLDEAIKGLMMAKFRNAGQTCISANRILLHRAISAEFLSKLRGQMAGLVLGEGFSPGVTLGPLINAKAAGKVNRLVASAAAMGAMVEEFGTLPPTPNEAYVLPKIITEVTPAMAIFNEEIFGPVVAVTCFDCETDAVTLANNTPFGLVAYAYTQNTSRIWRLSEQLQFGMLGINETRISNAMAPFGGIKESGFGREGGAEGIQEYLSTRYITWGGC